MSLTVEHDRAENQLKVVTDKTVELLDFEDANDFLLEVKSIVELIEEREIELDNLRFADEYGYAEEAWRE